MSITAAQLVFYKPDEVSDDSTNGGRLTSVSVTSGISNNIWPNVSEADRTAGGTWHRKIFCKVDSTENLDLENPVVYIEYFTPGDDAVYAFPATQDDIQGDLTGSERLYGCGYLNAQANTGTSTIVSVVEDPANLIFFAGDSIRISDKTDPGQAAGNTETNTIVGTPGIAGSLVTITLLTPLLNTYSAGVGSRVQSLYEPSSAAAAPSNFSVTSGAGTYDDTSYPPEMDSRGTIYEHWTLTFTNATNFTCTGDTLGDILQDGSRSLEYSPTNGYFSTPYFTINVLGWGGTFSNGDTIQFTTTPAAVPVWEKRIVPAGAASLSGNSVVLGFSGESA